MSDFFYVLKIAMLTLLVILIMQVDISGVSLENRVLTFVKTSTVTAPIRDISEQGVLIVKSAYNKTVHFLDTKLLRKKGTKGERSLFSLKRSDVIIEKEKKKEETQLLNSDDKAEAGY